MHALRLGVAILVLVFGVSLLAAAPKDKVPDPTKTANNVTKKLGQTTTRSSYNLYCLLHAGTTTKSNHEIERPSAGGVYDADIYKGYMRLNEDIDAYRNKQKGAIRPQGQTTWFDTDSTKMGRKLQRFLMFPDYLLERSLDKPKRVEWIHDDVLPEDDDDDEFEPVPTPADVDPDEKGTTEVAKRKGTEGAESAQVLPHVLRIELSSDVAREFFTEARNSGVWDSGSG